MSDDASQLATRRLPRSATSWAETVTAPEQAWPLGLVDAFAAGRHPELLEHLGQSGRLVMTLRERHRVGALQTVVEYVTMMASVMGAAALFTGRISPRVDYNFDASFAVPVAATGFTIALLGLILVHVTWVREGLPVSASGVAAAVITAVFGVMAVILTPITAADSGLAKPTSYLVPMLGAVAAGALSCFLQLRWGVTRVRPALDTPKSERLALQWAAFQRGSGHESLKTVTAHCNC